MFIPSVQVQFASTMCYDVPWVWFEAQHVVAAREVFAGTMVPVEVYKTGV